MTKSKKKKVSKKIPSSDLENAIGKTTIVKLTWKDWAKELPENGDRIYVIIKAKNGLVPVTGMYLDETLPANGPFPESRWQTVRFDDAIGTAILGGEGGECLVAWARPKKVGKLLNDSCLICKEFPCCC